MLNSLIIYFQFFTRIPIPIMINQPEIKLRSGVRYFTLFGLLLGLLDTAVFWIVQHWFDPMMAWMIVLFFDVIITGGFHLDALADMADGLFSSRNKARMLEIMKDSRVGSNGVLAIVFYYLFLILSFQSLIPFTNLWTQIKVIGLINLIGKNGISLLFYQMQYAGKSPNGLGAAFLKVKTGDIVGANSFSCLILGLCFNKVGIICFIANIVSMMVYRKMVLHKVGGFNGDTLGAASPISQTIYLLSLLVCRRFL